MPLWCVFGRGLSVTGYGTTSISGNRQPLESTIQREARAAVKRLGGTRWIAARSAMNDFVISCPSSAGMSCLQVKPLTVIDRMVSIMKDVLKEAGDAANLAVALNGQSSLTHEPQTDR